MNYQTDPQRMNLIAKLAFAPIYPYLAQQIRDKFGITNGICVDLGSGPASLAIAIARITDLTIYSLDIQPEMISVARQNIAEAGFSSRIRAVTADVCRMPFEDNSVDLMVSRGSIFFWEDRVTAFREIYRVLRPGGVAYCGGSLGDDTTRAQVIAAFNTIAELQPYKEDWQHTVSRNMNKLTLETMLEELGQAGVPGTVEKENGGIWAQIIKLNNEA